MSWVSNSDKLSVGKSKYNKQKRGDKRRASVSSLESGKRTKNLAFNKQFILLKKNVNQEITKKKKKN